MVSPSPLLKSVSYVGPCWVREKMLATRPLKDEERFAVVLFFLGNGVLPRAVAAYLAGSGLLSDERAHAHIWDILRDFRDGKLAFGTTYSCMEQRQDVYLHDPNCIWIRGAPDVMRDAMYWDDAKAILLGCSFIKL